MSFFGRKKRPAACRMRAHVEAHFDERISVREEAALREHLPGCDPCHALYDRLLLLGRLDPRAKSAESRLAHGLGLRPARRPLAFFVPVAAVASATVALLLLVRPGGRPGEFAARGGAKERPAEKPRLLAYRVDAARVSTPLDGKMAARDELAFGYSNPTGKKRILVFAVDEHNHVYWYHPAWRKPDENPAAVGIEAGVAPRELPESIAHELDGTALRIYGVFTDEALTVRAVESKVAGLAEPRLDGAIVTRMVVKVER